MDRGTSLRLHSRWGSQLGLAAVIRCRGLAVHVRVAVVGASGFIGRHVAARLGPDHQVVGVQRRPGAGQHVALDAATAGPEDWARAITGCDAVVNLLGIKQESGAATFEHMHVQAVQALVDACHATGVRRLVHVSVVVARPHPDSPYHDTKWRGEQIVRGSGLDWVVLRPGVVYGPGDDMLAHLSRMVRASPVFPVVAPGSQPMQPVDVEDVAEAVARALKGPAGLAVDVVGPDRLTLTDVVRHVAAADGFTVRVVPTPAWLMRLPVAAMAAVQRAPLSTPAQLRMLEEGLPGDPGPAAERLGLRTRAFSPRRIRQVVSRVPPPRWRLRLGAPWPTGAPRALPMAVAMWALATLGLAWALRSQDVWPRLVGVILGLGLVGALFLRRNDLRRPTVGQTVVALGVGVAGGAVAWLLLAVPAMAAAAAPIQAWPGGRPIASVLATVLVAVVAEEVFWRGAVQRGLGDRMPVGAAVLLGALMYALAHAAGGHLLLVAAALGMGIVWGLLFAVTRSLWPPVLCHAAWDVMVLVV